MVTPKGPIIAIDDSMAARVQNHPFVDLMGGVSLDPRGRASKYLESLFAQNLSRQIHQPAAEAVEPEAPEGPTYVRRTRPT